MPASETVAPELERLLEVSGALKKGHFLLSSGRHSSGYVQCAVLLEDPVRAKQVGAWLAEELRDLRPESVLAPALGGVVIGHVTAAALGVPFRFAERNESGVMQLRRGFSLRDDERFVVVEDVITTGQSVREVATLATAAGGGWCGVGSIIDRSRGAARLPVPVVSLLELDLPTWEASECELCAAGSRAEQPGSRPTG